MAGDLTFPNPLKPIQQLTETAARGLYTTSYYIRWGAIFSLLGLAAVFIFTLLFSKSSYFPKTPSNVEINARKILNRLNKK